MAASRRRGVREGEEAGGRQWRAWAAARVESSGTGEARGQLAGARLRGRELLRELERAGRVHANDVAQEEAPVGRVAHLLAVHHDLVELPRLHEALDHLRRG